MSSDALYWFMVAGAAIWSGCVSYWLWDTFIKTKNHGHRIDKLEISVEDLQRILGESEEDNK